MLFYPELKIASLFFFLLEFLTGLLLIFFFKSSSRYVTWQLINFFIQQLSNILSVPCLPSPLKFSLRPWFLSSVDAVSSTPTMLLFWDMCGFYHAYLLFWILFSLTPMSFSFLIWFYFPPHPTPEKASFSNFLRKSTYKVIFESLHIWNVFILPNHFIVRLGIESPGENSFFSKFWRLLYCLLVSSIAPGKSFVIPFLHFLLCELFFFFYLFWFFMAIYHDLSVFSLVILIIWPFLTWKLMPLVSGKMHSIFILLISSLLFSSIFSFGTQVC